MGNDYKVMRFSTFVLFILYIIQVTSKISLSITGDRWKYLDYNKATKQIENVFEIIDSAFFFLTKPLSHVRVKTVLVLFCNFFC